VTNTIAAAGVQAGKNCSLASCAGHTIREGNKATCTDITLSGKGTKLHVQIYNDSCQSVARKAITVAKTAKEYHLLD
jgi:hypothetical protein